MSDRSVTLVAWAARFQYYISSVKSCYFICIFSLNWQHQLCKNPRPNPDIKTLFTDHSCASSNGTRVPPPTNAPLGGPIPKPGAFPPLGGHGVSRMVSIAVIPR